MTIYKFPIKYGTNRVQARQQCKVLSVGLDPSEQLCVWALLDPDNERYDLTVVVIFTGETFYPATNTFVGTVRDGGLMYHVFAS